MSDNDVVTNFTIFLQDSANIARTTQMSDNDVVTNTPDKEFEWPRRARIDKFVPAEKAIYDAVQAVEAMPADVRLTNAVILLQQAREAVADFVDDVTDSPGTTKPLSGGPGIRSSSSSSSSV